MEDWTGPFRPNQLQNGLSSIPEGGGLYLWRRGPPIRSDAFGSPELLLNQIKEASRAMYLAVDGLTPERSNSGLARRGFLRLQNLEVGGAEFSPALIDKMQYHFGETSARLAFQKAVNRATSNFGPVLYVGESSFLRNRIEQHLAQGSPLRKRVTRLGLDFDTLTVWCMPTPGMAVEARRALESIITAILVAPATFRAG